MDYTGALIIRNDDGLLQNVYICLFTCAPRRAIDLEVVPNLSENSFIQAFQRLVAGNLYHGISCQTKQQHL